MPRAYNDYARKGGADGRGKWLYGYACGIEEKVEQLLADGATRMRAQRGNALAPLSLIAKAETGFVDQYGPLGRPLVESDFVVTPAEFIERYLQQGDREPKTAAERQAELASWRAYMKRNPAPS